MENLVGIEVDHINRLTGQPVWWVDHFHRTRAGPFKVDKAANVPMVVHKNVALVEIGETQKEGPPKKITAEKTRSDTFHNHQRTDLIKTILQTINGIALVSKPALME